MPLGFIVDMTYGMCITHARTNELIHSMARMTRNPQPARPKKTPTHPHPHPVARWSKGLTTRLTNPRWQNCRITWFRLGPVFEQRLRDQQGKAYGLGRGVSYGQRCVPAQNNSSKTERGSAPLGWRPKEGKRIGARKHGMTLGQAHGFGMATSLCIVTPLGCIAGEPP